MNADFNLGTSMLGFVIMAALIALAPLIYIKFPKRYAERIRHLWDTLIEGRPSPPAKSSNRQTHSIRTGFTALELPRATFSFPRRKVSGHSSGVSRDFYV